MTYFYFIEIDDILQHLRIKREKSFKFIFPLESSILFDYWDRVKSTDYFVEIVKNKLIFDNLNSEIYNPPLFTCILLIELNEEEALHLSLAGINLSVDNI